MKRRADCTPAACSDTKRSHVLRRLVATSSSSKASVARVLSILNDEGLLAAGMVTSGSNQTRKRLSKAVEDTASTPTPFGTVVQQMTLDRASPSSPFSWDFIHPMALLYCLSTISSALARLMSNIVADGKTLRIVLFIDEFRPGNVLRPDSGRATNNIFWTFAEFPQWLLRRADAWFTFGCIRSKIAGQIPGCVSGLMKHVLLTFFAESGPSFETGVTIVNGSEAMLVRAVFGGFLGDEKGLKEAFASKGPGGTKPCLSCKNIVQFLDVSQDPYLCDIATLPDRFDSATDGDIWAIAAKLSTTASGGTRADLERQEQSFGLNYEPCGIMFDDRCRRHVKPVTGWLRDYLHVFLVSGIANIVQQAVVALRTAGIPSSLITDYFALFNLPRSHGKVNDDWFTTKRLGNPSADKDGWRGFASELLLIVPILLSFLEAAVAPRGVLPSHVACFKLLDRLLKLFALGPQTAAQHRDRIRQCMLEHAVLYKTLYRDVIKPKFHHQFHLLDHIDQLDLLASCWVTERKHRATKQIANHTFGNYEKTLVRDMLNQHVSAAESESLFVPEFLPDPKRLSPNVPHAADYVYDRQAQLLCGTIHVGDAVMLSDRACGIVDKILQRTAEDRSIWLVLRAWRRLSELCYSASGEATLEVVSADKVLEAVMWCSDGGVIRVLPPRIAATWG